MTSIVTFYSYKGGVGRSMALANVAVQLARRGRRVLVVDWDLEAPGLERYFSHFNLEPGRDGLLRMFLQARDGHRTDFHDFTCTVHCDTPHPITLLASGREQDEDYAKNLERFDWEAFFAGGGGAFVEELRDRWRQEFEFVLVDSRTGLSDTGGICTIQIPDIVVAMFTANHQSLYGVRDVMSLAQRARQSLAYDRMPLSILPLPARWGMQEFQESQLWLDRIAETMQELCADWLPRSIRLRQVLEQVKVPQVSYFSYGERLAVVEQGTSDPQGMGFVYDKVAAFIASDFADVDALLGKPAAAQVDDSFPTPAAPQDEYRYDVFVSYDGSSIGPYFEKLVDTLRHTMTMLRGEPFKFFMNVREIAIGEVWESALADALIHSKVVLALITPSYLRNRYALMEFQTFSARSLQTHRRLLAPVVLHGDTAAFPPAVREVQWLDLRSLGAPFQSAFGSPKWQEAMLQLSQTLTSMIEEAPSFDPSWTIAADIPPITAPRLWPSLTEPTGS